jgi:hypothetical protein
LLENDRNEKEDGVKDVSLDIVVVDDDDKKEREVEEE